MLTDVIISNKFLLRKINGLKLFFFYSDKRYLISKYIYETALICFSLGTFNSADRIILFYSDYKFLLPRSKQTLVEINIPPIRDNTGPK